MRLEYEPASDGRLIDQFAIYHVESKYSVTKLQDIFLELKANVCDLNPSLVAKCITGTEQDFIMLMNRANASIDGTYYPSGSYTHDQDGGTVTMKTYWKDETSPSCSS